MRDPHRDPFVLTTDELLDQLYVEIGTMAAAMTRAGHPSAGQPSQTAYVAAVERLADTRLEVGRRLREYARQGVESQGKARALLARRSGGFNAVTDGELVNVGTDTDPLFDTPQVRS